MCNMYKIIEKPAPAPSSGLYSPVAPLTFVIHLLNIYIATKTVVITVSPHVKNVFEYNSFYVVPIN
jgi:hypothetical protein